MLTEPEALLFLARRCGLSIRRDGGLMRVESMNGKPIPGIWAEALKRHKPELMPLLPSLPAQGAKGGNPGRPRKPHPKPLGQGDMFDPLDAATEGKAPAEVVAEPLKAKTAMGGKLPATTG